MIQCLNTQGKCPPLACITNGGEVPDTPCLFPWTYPLNGRTYVGCANPHKDPAGDWCPTKLNENNEFEIKSGNWGYCSDNCRKDKGMHIFHCIRLATF